LPKQMDLSQPLDAAATCVQVFSRRLGFDYFPCSGFSPALRRISINREPCT
jgi:hypothetical protein